MVDGLKKEKKYATESRLTITNGIENYIISSENPVLSAGDVITVRFKTANSFKRVTILGEVNYPGSYVITNSEELVTDIIKRAGGLTKEAYTLSSSFVRDGEAIKLSFERIIRNPRSSSNFTVISGDSIIINGYTNIVKIIGEVNNSGSYQFLKNKKSV